MELYERRNFLSVLMDIFFDVHLWAPILCLAMFVAGGNIKEKREANAWNQVESFARKIYQEHPNLVNLNALSSEDLDFTVRSAEYLLDGGVHLWVKSDAWSFSGDFYDGNDGFAAKDSSHWEFSGERRLSLDMILDLLGFFGVGAWVTYELSKRLFAEEA